MAVYGKQFTSEPEIRIIRKKQGGGGAWQRATTRKEKKRGGWARGSRYRASGEIQEARTISSTSRSLHTGGGEGGEGRVG